MNINLTLFGEMITFTLLVWVTVKYIWPPLLSLIAERQQKIAAGLEAAEQGQRALKEAEVKIIAEFKAAKSKSLTLIDQANQKANSLVTESRIQAELERNLILAQAKIDLKQEVTKVKGELQRQSVELIMVAVEKLLKQKIDEASQQKLVEQLFSKI